MAASWQFRGGLLVVTEEGVTSNDELERVFVSEALSDPRARPGLSVLWDARGSETPLSSEDFAWRVDVLRSLAARGLLSSLALLVRAGHVGLTADLGRQMAAAVQPLRFDAFDEESKALAWLSEGTSPD
ncbi:MAG: hypothetical protein ACHP85_04635 [Burkholderiales bacterium]|jgi:hypothetical protein